MATLKRKLRCETGLLSTSQAGHGAVYARAGVTGHEAGDEARHPAVLMMLRRMGNF